MRNALLSLGFVLATSLVGCGGAKHRYEKPWFRVATAQKHVVAPHALGWGGGRTLEMLSNGKWRELDHAEPFSVHPVGDSVAIDEKAGVFLYREAHTAIHIPRARCATPRFSPSPAEIACFGCGEREPYGKLGEGESCGMMHVDTYDAFGALVSSVTFPSPMAKPYVEGRLAGGSWVLGEGKMPDDFLYRRAPDPRFLLDANGLQALPFGADPLNFEADAQERAQAILREAPIRDAAVASLRAALSGDERVRPSWVEQSELLNRLDPNEALERTLPAKPGTCYAFVARASEGVTQLELSVHGSPPFVPTSISDNQEGVFAFATGAPDVTVSRCVQMGDPPTYHFRVGSRGGSGYVLARVYSYPEPRR